MSLPLHLKHTTIVTILTLGVLSTVDVSGAPETFDFQWPIDGTVTQDFYDDYSGEPQTDFYHIDSENNDLRRYKFGEKEWLDRSLFNHPPEEHTGCKNYGHLGCLHRAIDIAPRIDIVPGSDDEGKPVYVYPARNGTVWFGDHGNTCYGRFAVVDHENGYWTVYAHMEKQKLELQGIYVTVNEHFGTVGKTGCGPNCGKHLHFEIRKTDTFIETACLRGTEACKEAHELDAGDERRCKGIGYADLAVFIPTGQLDAPGNFVTDKHVARHSWILQHYPGVSTAAVAPPPPENLSPIDNAQVTGGLVLFTWNARQDSSRFHFQLQRKVDNDWTDSFATVTTASTIEIPLSRTQGEFRWRVRAGNAAQSGDWSSYSLFRKSTNVQLDAPELIAPTKDDVLDTHSVTVSWHDVDGADSYLVEIQDLEKRLVGSKTVKSESAVSLQVPSDGEFHAIITAAADGIEGASSETTFSVRTGEDELPDLRVTAHPDAQYELGQDIGIDVTILKDGGPIREDASSPIAAAYLSSDNQLDRSDLSVWRSRSSPPDIPMDALNEAGQYSIALQPQFPDQDFSGFLIFEIDSLDDIRETDESNNLAVYPLVLELPRNRPDLVIDNLSLTPSNGTQGTSVQIDAGIRNQGTSTADRSVARFRINNNPQTVTTSDLFLLEINVPVIAAGDSYSVARTITLPDTVGLGVHYIWLTLDVFSTANQSDETNDQATEMFEVVASSAALDPPSISSVSPDPVTGSNDPQRFTINGGNFQAGASVTLRDHRTGEIFPARAISSLSETQIVINPTFTTEAANWSVEVINPDGKTTGQFHFDIVAPTTEAPSISSVSPNPVTGADEPQMFTINGSNFQSGANVTLRDHRTGEVFPERTISSLSETQIVIKPTFTTEAATWSVEVINPDGQSSGELSFDVESPTTEIQADGFDFPFGPPDGTPRCPGSDQCADGWQNVQAFGETNEAFDGKHLGEDWNFGFSSDDLGSPIFAAAAGEVVYAQDFQADTTDQWEGIIIIRHGGQDFCVSGGEPVTTVETFYGHLDVDQINEWVTNGSHVDRGEQIAVIGPKPKDSTGPHLHFEVRTDTSIGVVSGYSDDLSGWVNPTEFIEANRPHQTDGCTEVSSDSRPTISNVFPSSMPASSTSQTLTISGSNFQSGATLQFRAADGGLHDSDPNKLTFVSSSQIRYQLNNGNDAGTWTVKVINPDDQSSSAVSFTVEASTPAPTISDVFPSSMPASSISQTLTINGSNFQSGATLQFRAADGGLHDSDPNKLTFVSGSQIRYQLNNGNDAGTWTVKVINPDDQSSSEVSFTVEASTPAPTISDVFPSSMPASSTSQTLTINGSNFQNGARLQFRAADGGLYDSDPNKLTFVSSSEIRYQLNNGNDAGTWTVKVINPDGLQSNPASFTVN